MKTSGKLIYDKDLVITVVSCLPKINHSDIQRLLIYIFSIGLSLLLCYQRTCLKEMLSGF